MVQNYKTFVVPPGIGDSAWVYMKLCNLDYDFNIEISSPKNEVGNNIMRRAGGLMEILPKVKSYKYLDFAVWHDDDTLPLSSDKMWIQANLHLESGKRIESFLPSIPTNLHFDINLPKCEKYGKIILYTASLRANMNWRGWLPEDWDNIIGYLIGMGLQDDIVMVGAEWDRDYLWYCHQSYPDIEYMIGEPLESVLAVVNQAKLLVGFPSGIPIMSIIMGTPTVMFYPKHLEKMMYTFHDKDTEHKYYCAVYGTDKASVTMVKKWIEQWI